MDDPERAPSKRFSGFETHSLPRAFLAVTIHWRSCSSTDTYSQVYPHWGSEHPHWSSRQEPSDRQIKGDYIIVQGRLLTATYRSNTSFDPNIAQNYLLFDGKEIGTTIIYFDEAGGKPSENEIIFCLPIFVSPSFSRVSGLILLPTRIQKAEY